MTNTLNLNGFERVNGQDFDASLLTRVRAGDEGAFRIVYLKLYNPLFHFIRRLTGSENDAEDICQETFATLWLKHGQVDADKNIKTYLFGIAKRVVWNHMRSRHKQQALFEEAAADPAGGIDPEAVLQLSELEILTQYAVGKLPPRTREVYEMHLYDNLSNEQIAQKLDITPENVRSRIYEARKIVRQIVQIIVAAAFFNSQIIN